MTHQCPLVNSGVVVPIKSAGFDSNVRIETDRYAFSGRAFRRRIKRATYKSIIYRAKLRFYVFTSLSK